ncbi:uncharacterized protein C6orf163 homolog [Babylonia areolata]|uniref:uncharacterized protein C6orf163 homolog n=1 Tax=Babylonia areolata TaxID=304850 RepID=UPI003FD1A308
MQKMNKDNLKMDLTASVKFPQLAPRYQGMPRRYEETKPVVIQDFTHRKILGIGYDIQSRLLDRLEREKTEAIEATEVATWEKAEKKKHSAVKKVRDEAAKKIEKALEQQSKDHEQRIKEEVIRVEMAMQKLAIEQVQEERAKGEKQLAQAVQQVEERCATELEQAVAQARQEERDVAAENIKVLNEKHEALIEDLRKAHVVDIAQELALLTVKKDQERDEAVQKAREYEQKLTKDIVSKMTAKFEAEIKQESEKIYDKIIQIQDLKTQLDSAEKEKERLAEFLHTTRFWFQDFIDRVQQVQKGYADFILPPAYIEEIERGLMNAQPAVNE